MRGIRTLLLSLAFMTLIYSESQGMQSVWRACLDEQPGFRGHNATHEQASFLLSGSNCRTYQNEYLFVQESGMPIGTYVGARQANPQIPIQDMRDNFLVDNRFAQLATVPNISQSTAGRYLYRLQRKNFSLEDLIATVYLQTNDEGRGGLRGLLLSPTLDQIDTSKYLLALPLVSFTQEDLEAAVHLRTNPGNVWDAPILNPMREEIQAAKTLRARAPQFTKAELLQEWQSQVSQEITPLLQRLAEESKKRAVLYFDEECAQLMDAEAAQLIEAVPPLLHAALRANYDQLKRDFVITDAHLGAALEEVRAIAAEVFADEDKGGE